MQDLTFAQPLWLYAGIALAVALLLAFRYLDGKNRRDLEQFASGRFLAGIRMGISKPRRLFKRGCYVMGVLLLFAALARPQIGFEWREVRRKGIDILFAIDSSRSMLAEDMSPNRLERVKLGMIDFVEKLDGDRIGLLPFSGSSFLLCPLTLDYHTFETSLDAVDTEIIPHKGTDIASAIREADAIFEEAGNNHRILVVLTDGEDLQGEALAAAREAAENGMIIHTVGIGSPEGELIPIGGTYLQDASGNPVKTKLDEAGLKAISEATEGTYVRFGQLGEGLQTIYQQKLALVPKEELKQRMQKVPVEQYQWPLGAAILLFLIEFIISDRRRFAGSARNAGGAPLAKATLILIAGFLAHPNTARAESAPERYNSGITAFTDGELDNARQAFRDTLSKTSDLGLQARSYYNLGNTLFSIGAQKLKEQDTKGTIKDWEESLTSYENSLKLNPEDPDAEHNRDYVKKLLDELKKQEDPQDQQEENEDEKQDESEDRESEEDSEKKDQSNSESEEQDQEKQDQEQSDENKEGESEEKQEGDSEEKEGENQQEGDESGEEEKQGKSGEESEEEKEGEESQQSKEGEEGGESEEKEGKPGEKEGRQGEEKDANQAAGEQARSAPGEMSPEEAKELLKALKKDEKRVILIPQKAGERQPRKNNTRGKDW